MNVRMNEPIVTTANQPGPMPTQCKIPRTPAKDLPEYATALIHVQMIEPFQCKKAVVLCVHINPFLGVNQVDDRLSLICYFYQGKDLYGRKRY